MMVFLATLVIALARPPVASAFHTKIAGAFGRTATAGFALYATGNERPSFASLIGGMASSLMGGGGGSGATMVSANKELDEKLDEMVPSWESVRVTLESQQTGPERAFRENLPLGYGMPSPLHKIRLYNESNSKDDIRVTFYRDSASWCPYCQKVWIALEHKQIPYAVEKINMRCYGDKPVSFQVMQPSGQIPVAIIDGTVLRQSNDILATLDRDFPESPSLAAPKGMESRAQELLRLERVIFSVWMTWLTSGGDGERLKKQFIETLRSVEGALLASKGPFFLGNSMTIVDVQFAPFMERMAASLLYYKGFTMRVAPNTKTDFPAVNRWFDAMENLPAYQVTKGDYYSHCWDLPPQLGGCYDEPAGEIYASAINGERLLDGSRGSWELPLQPHNGGVEPDWPWAGSDAEARREAVERLSTNCNAIVNFAARGAGQKGVPSVSAALADPNAKPNLAVQTAVDSILRLVCTTMVDGRSPVLPSSAQTDQMKSLAMLIVQEGGLDFANGVVNSLAYLRDRIGVPRDMKLPAARLLRAHLNWSIGFLLEARDKVE